MDEAGKKKMKEMRESLTTTTTADGNGDRGTYRHIEGEIQKPGAKNSRFEDARITNRVHHVTILISNCLMAFAMLCMVLSMVGQEFEIGKLLNSSRLLADD